MAAFHYVVKHGFALDEVVFEVSFPSEKNFCSLTTTKPARANVQNLMHILTDLVEPDIIGKERGTIATF